MKVSPSGSSFGANFTSLLYDEFSSVIENFTLQQVFAELEPFFYFFTMANANFPFPYPELCITAQMSSKT